jgi:hypothetical protein
MNCRMVTFSAWEISSSFDLDSGEIFVASCTVGIDRVALIGETWFGILIHTPLF